MLKKILFQLISVMAIMMCCITANAYSDENSDVCIDVIRTGEMNTYNINITYTMFNLDSIYADDIKDALKPYREFSEVQTDYRCVLYADGVEIADIGYGTANRYFPKSGIISWDYEYTFPCGSHTVDAEIYRRNRLVNSWFADFNVYPPGLGYIHDYDTITNFAYEYQFANRINRMRLDSGMNSAAWRDTLEYVAEDTLFDAIYNDNFTHDDVLDYYHIYNPGFTSYEELFISGASTVDEAMYLLMNSYKGYNIIYGDYDMIGIGAVSNDQGVMYWCIEAASY